MQEWIEYKSDYGEERDDLRMGAIASLLINLNVDTRKMGGQTRPNRYISTWDNEREYHLVYRYDEDEGKKGESKSANSDNVTGNIMTKSSWENMKAGFAKAFGRKMIKKDQDLKD